MSIPPEKIWLFRMLHWQNVAYVLEHGICCREHVLADPNYINIGHRQLITDRHAYPIGLDGAGNLGEYVPFYFAGHSPMLYLIMNGYKGVEQRPQEDLVYILCDFEVIRQQNLSFVFTDRNAKLRLAQFYDNPSDFDQLHWDVINSRTWKNDADNLSRRDYKQAEFLVRDHVPVECIHGLVVKTEERKAYFDTLVDRLDIDIKVFWDKELKLYY